MKKILILLVILIISFVFFYKEMIFQEGNPLPIIKGIFELTFSDENLVEIGENKYIVKFTKEASEYDITNKSLDEYISKNALDGWVFKEQFGAGFMFIKDNKKMIAATRMYTSKFIIIYDF